MKELMQGLREASIKAIGECDSVDVLEQLRVKYLGKKASLPPSSVRWASSPRKNAP